MTKAQYLKKYPEVILTGYGATEKLVINKAELDGFEKAHKTKIKDIFAIQDGLASGGNIISQFCASNSNLHGVVIVCQNGMIAVFESDEEYIDCIIVNKPGE